MAAGGIILHEGQCANVFGCDYEFVKTSRTGTPPLGEPPLLVEGRVLEITPLASHEHHALVPPAPGDFALSCMLDSRFVSMRSSGRDFHVEVVHSDGAVDVLHTSGPGQARDVARGFLNVAACRVFPPPSGHVYIHASVVDHR